RPGPARQVAVKRLPRISLLCKTGTFAW
ncbi:MAG: hypothetical protein QOE61_1760, partial [Micromonosporaceae bacterium]|nr:hypothetical protein [Micromonosporaceae bacterium]